MMKHPKKILIPHDFSRCASQAFANGIELAVKTRAHLHVLHVEIFHEKSVLGNPSPASTKAEQLHQKLVEELEACIQEQGLSPSTFADLDLTYAVEKSYSAAHAIVQYCWSHDIDLVMMGTHGRSGIERMMNQASSYHRPGIRHLGSVAEAVVRMAPCSVFTKREYQNAQCLRDNLRVITVPIDFSEGSLEAIKAGHLWASLFGASLEMFHVLKEWVTPVYLDNSYVLVFDDKENESKARQQMESLVDEAGAGDIPVQFTIVEGDPASEIIDRVSQQLSDLLVMVPNNTPGGDIEEVGSTLERVVRGSIRPVLTVKGRPALTESSFKQAAAAGSMFA